MQRAVIVVECDNDHKTVEKVDAEAVLPPPWTHIMLTVSGTDDDGDPVAFDACSLGCAERSLIRLIRDHYNVPEESGVGIQHGRQ